MEKKSNGIGGIITAVVFVALLFPFAFISILGIFQSLLCSSSEKLIEVPELVYYSLPIYFVAVLFMIYSMTKRYDYLEENQHYYCPNCNESVKYDARVCPHCGADLEELKEHIDKPGKKRLYAILFAVFLGGLGIHNYYLKKYKCFYKELTISLLTVGLLLPIIYFVAIIDAIRMGTNSIKYDGDGKLLS